MTEHSDVRSSAPAASPSFTPDDSRQWLARQHAAILVGNLRTLLSECEAILQQAEDFATTATWLESLAHTEWHLDRITQAMAKAGRLMVAG